MKASETKLLDFLHSSRQFAIPIYQRTYSWTEKECIQLWDDIVHAGSNDDILVHFIGSIVYIDKADANITSWEPLLVIDGQQRLTSVSLILAALAEAVADTEPFDGFSRRKIENYYLLNPEESGERHFKLLLSQTDKESLTSIVNKQEMPRERSIRIEQNYKLFKELIASRGSDLIPVCKGLNKLLMVDIKLKRGEDNPQLIFESMNSLGKELSQADLIRNFVLMGLESDLQSRLYQQYWRPIEVEFGQDAYSTDFDSFMRHYLTVKTGDIPRIGDVYEAFKSYSHSTFSEPNGIEALVKDINHYAGHYCAMALNKEQDIDLNMAFDDLRELKVDVAFPFLLVLYDDYIAGTLSKDDFLKSIRLIEAYVFRRVICDLPTNSMNKTFATFHKALNKDRYLESIQAHFLLLKSYRSFPTDDEFKRNIQTHNLYHIRSGSYWLRRLENYERRERVMVNELTVEHILPQNNDLHPEWKAALGNDWKIIQETWLHTLGNLTLTAYNSEFSDRPFVYKRDMPDAPEKGLRQSPLKLNQELGALDSWNENTIKDRAKKLASLAINVWSAPSLAQEILETYVPKDDIKHEYTINDHPYLVSGSEMYGTGVRQLFDTFRKAVLDLDPCVTEEYLKQYVAYKAETNFVDVVPQAKRLRLTLNMRFTDVIDPKGICKDTTGIGRWGNGDVEVALSSLDELPYVIGLVRQALEKQMGSN